MARARRIGRVRVKQNLWLAKRERREASMGTSSKDAAGRWLAEKKNEGKPRPLPEGSQRSLGRSRSPSVSVSRK